MTQYHQKRTCLAVLMFLIHTRGTSIWNPLTVVAVMQISYTDSFSIIDVHFQKKVHLFSLYIRNHYNFRCSLKYIRTTEFLYFIFWDNFKNFRVDKIDIYSNKMRFFCGRVRNERYWLFCVLRILRQLTIKIILSRIWKKKVVIAPDFGFRQGCQ